MMMNPEGGLNIAFPLLFSFVRNVRTVSRILSLDISRQWLIRFYNSFGSRNLLGRRRRDEGVFEVTLRILTPCNHPLMNF
jgi:hypothetical protein